MPNNSFTIASPSGQLELVIDDAIVHPTPFVGVVCHPHPLSGGTMQNKVVTTLARLFNRLNVVAIRFNYRGVGNSEGSYADGLGETEDLLTVLQWTRQHYPQHAVWLAGFSFGAYVSLRAAYQVELAQLISIAPAVHLYDFVNLTAPPCPWIVVQGGQDTVVDPNLVKAWVEKQQPTPEFIQLPAACHYFHGQLQALQAALLPHLEKFFPN